jgi:hypothetical protein
MYRPALNAEPLINIDNNKKTTAHATAAPARLARTTAKSGTKVRYSLNFFRTSFHHGGAVRENGFGFTGRCICG